MPRLFDLLGESTNEEKLRAMAKRPIAPKKTLIQKPQHYAPQAELFEEALLVPTFVGDRGWSDSFC
jgi:hypothetical protein